MANKITINDKTSFVPFSSLKIGDLFTIENHPDALHIAVANHTEEKNRRGYSPFERPKEWDFVVYNSIYLSSGVSCKIDSRKKCKLIKSITIERE